MDESFGRVIYLALILAALAGWVMVEYRSRLGEAARTALARGPIVVGLMAGYGIGRTCNATCARR